MPGTFTYFNKETGKTEQRPIEPSYLDRVVENVTAPEDLDKARTNYVKTQANLKSFDKPTYTTVDKK